MLIENVNKTLKRKGIIGVTDSTGSTRYYLDGRRGMTDTANQITNAVSELKDNIYDDDSQYWSSLYDIAAKRVFFKYDIDLSYIGSSVLYSMVRDTVESDFRMPTNLKDMWALSEQCYGMSYSQMVRNVRYAISQSVLAKMRSRAAINFLAIEIMIELENIRKGNGGPDLRV